VNTVMNFRVPSIAGNPSSGYTVGGFLSSAQLHIVNERTPSTLKIEAEFLSK
jgi:hypothetical protein